MSDYGFCTYNEKTGKGRDRGVNSKYPIFGPKYGDIKKAFKTVHIIDTKQYDFRSSPGVSLPVAGGNTISEYHGYEKNLIATIPHGYEKRPLGYATISGNFVKNTRGKWIYSKSFDKYNFYPPPTTSLNTKIIRGGMLGQGEDIVPNIDTGSFNIFENNPFSGSGIVYPENMSSYLTQNDYFIPGSDKAEADTLGDYRPPYGAEIDSKNVYLYRYYYWSDVYKRDYYYSYEMGQLLWDLRARMFGIIDYAGSEFDLTIYLCPYSMEDLV